MGFCVESIRAGGCGSCGGESLQAFFVGSTFRVFRAALIALPLLFGAGAVQAQSLHDALVELLQTSKKVRAAEADMKSALEKSKEALGGWFPTFDVTGNYGYERQLKGNNTADTSMPPREVDLKLTQLLWDFGTTNKNIENARITYEQAKTTLIAARQAVLLEGITAYMDLIRRRRLLEFSKGSEDNIKRQTELEDARVQRGSGFSTDVLQAKAELAGAQAVRVRAEGALEAALNRYVAVFGKPPEKPDAMAQPRIPVDMLPTDVEGVVKLATQDNPNLRAARMNADIARNNISKTKSEKFAPTINLIGENKYKNDVEGTIGQRHEQLVKVEMKYSFNLGFTAINTLKASEHTLSATENRFGDAMDTTIEQSKNSWNELNTSRRNAEHLRNQANIAAEFLELARKERALGRRSLIDVLSGETRLINASSDAASAETDVAISVFKLLAVMGKLDETVVK